MKKLQAALAHLKEEWKSAWKHSGEIMAEAKEKVRQRKEREARAKGGVTAPNRKSEESSP